MCVSWVGFVVGVKFVRDDVVDSDMSPMLTAIW